MSFPSICIFFNFFHQWHNFPFVSFELFWLILLLSIEYSDVVAHGITFLIFLNSCLYRNTADFFFYVSFVAWNFTKQTNLVSLAVFLEPSRFPTNRTVSSTNRDDLMASIPIFMPLYLLILLGCSWLILPEPCWVEAVKENRGCVMCGSQLLKCSSSLPSLLSIFIMTRWWPLSNTSHICGGPHSIFILHADGLSALTLDN